MEADIGDSIAPTQVQFTKTGQPSQHLDTLIRELGTRIQVQLFKLI
jgi:hypothetical protein